MSNQDYSAVIGLYRHFKGEYYYVQQIAQDCSSGELSVIYFNVCHPEYGMFNRPFQDFITKFDEKEVQIVDRPDNKTGQHARFEKVYDLNFQLGSVSTQTLIEELRGRADSPLQDIAFYGLSDRVAYKDYCIGIEYEATDFTPYGIMTESTFDEKEKALKYFHTHKHSSRAHIFKRVFVREEE